MFLVIFLVTAVEQDVGQADVSGHIFSDNAAEQFEVGQCMGRHILDGQLRAMREGKLGCILGACISGAGYGRPRFWTM